MIYFCCGWWVMLSAFFNLFFFLLSVTGTAFYYATNGSPAPSGAKRRAYFLGGFHNDVPHFSQTLVCVFYDFFRAILSVARYFSFSVVSNERREQRRFYAFLFVLLVQFEAIPSSAYLLSNHPLLSFLKGL